MINAFYISKSGVKSYQESLNIISNNLANVSTDGFKAQIAEFEELIYTDTDNTEGTELTGTVGSGSKITVKEDSTPGAPIFYESEISERSNVDLTAELARMITSQRGYQLNSKMIQTADELEQTANNLIR